MSVNLATEKIEHPLGSAKRSRAAREMAMVEFWSVSLPRLFDPDLPLLADATADGAWTSLWPPVAAYLPLAALMLGFVAPLVTKAISNPYANSLIFTGFAVAGAILSGTFGVMLFAGYALGSLIITFVRMDAWSLAELMRQIGRLLVSDLVLAIPTLLVPRVAYGFVPPVPDRIASRPGMKQALRGGLYAASCALLVFSWCQGLPTMMRPLVGLVQGQLGAHAISPVTWHAPVVVFAAAAAALIRFIIEGRFSQSARTRPVADLKRKRWLGHRRRGIFSRIPKFVRSALSTGVAMLVIGGTCTTWSDAIVIAALVGTVLVARVQLLRRLPAQWMTTVKKLPILLRFTTALAGGYLLSSFVIRLLWSTASMRAVTVSTLLSLTLFTLLCPDGTQLPTSAAEKGDIASTSPSFGTAVIALLFGWTALARAQVGAAHAAQGYTGLNSHGHNAALPRFGNPACVDLHSCYSDPISAGGTSSAIAGLAYIAIPDNWNSACALRPQMEQTSSATSDPDSTKDGTPASDEAEVGDLLDAIRQALQQSGSGSDGGVHAMIGSAQDAWYTFSKFAQPGTIRPHPNRAVRDAGGYIAEMPGGAVIGFRPFSKSGLPVIDLHGVRGFDWLRKFKFLH